MVRHGETAYNAESGGKERIKGWKNVALNEEGKREDLALAKLLASVPILEIYFSNLQRAAWTARAIANAQPNQRDRPKLVPVEELRSWDLGGFVGKELDKLEPILRVYQTRRPFLPVPPGDETQGESWNAFVRPFLRWMSKKMLRARRM